MGQEQSNPSSQDALISGLSGNASTVASGQPAAGALFDIVPELANASSERLSSLATFTSKRIGSLRNEIKRLSMNGNQGFVQTYKGITAGLGSPATASNAPDNIHLNRYTNIVAYDATRVTVQPKRSNFNSDYINANWINGRDGNKHYIATQGPVPASIGSFWQMVHENHVHVIVMVTNEVEGDRLKCHRYWPSAEEGQVTHGELTIELTNEIVHATFVERHLTATPTDGGQPQKVVQLAYTAWPDHGVPATTIEMLNFRRIVRNVHKSFNEGPLLTHCSAGVGRTGTFVGLDRYLTAVLNEEEVDILPIVEDMRRCRNMMVQSQIQFVYLYLACLDGMERFAALLDKELARLAMSPEERQEREIEEIQAQLVQEEDIMGTIKMKRKQENRVDARSMFGGPADDVETARSISALKRKESLTAASQRKHSTVSTEDRGYYEKSAPSLEQRLEALVVSRDQWVNKYESAQRQWEESQTGGGTAYNLEEELSPLESRIQSLANAQEAFDARKKSASTTLEEVNALDSLAGLTARLESLRTTIISDEDRWRKRGHGFAQQKDIEPPKPQHTVDMLGSLFDRVKLLQTEQEEWQRRVSKAYDGEETFKAEVANERHEQEQRELERRKREEEAKQRAAREAEEAKAKASEDAMLAAAKAEEERKKAIKARMKEVATTPKRSYEPQQRRKSDHQAAIDAEKEEKKKKEEEERAKKAEEAKIKAAEEKKKTSERKANKFMSKLMSKK